jgi:HAMP domain-containing protein
MLTSRQTMARNLTSQVRAISDVTKAVAAGDLSREVKVDVQGEMLDLKVTVNTMVSQLNSFSNEVTRVAMEVGTKGILGGQATVDGVQGTWAELTNNVNVSQDCVSVLRGRQELMYYQTMARNLTSQVRAISDVTKAVAAGDLSRTVEVDVQGEMLELKNTVNTMVAQLSSFSNEVTRVAMEVGTKGILGGQARVEGVRGTWADLTDSVNTMAQNLTEQVRAISDVTKAVADGDLSQKVNVDVQGEMLDLKRTVNTMVNQLSSFSSEVTRVAMEVGTEGRLGGQAAVPGVKGTWAELTMNVNVSCACRKWLDYWSLTTSVDNGCKLDKPSTSHLQGHESRRCW